MDLQNLKPKNLKLIEIIFVKRNYRINLLLQRASYQNLKSHSLFIFLEVVVQQPLFSSLLLSYIPGEGPGSWLMHFPYVVLHGIFGKF